MPILRRHHGRQAAERERAANLWSGAHEVVFTTQFGPPIGPRKASRDLAAILARTALPRVTFHELRHSCGSLLLALRLDIKASRRSWASPASASPGTSTPMSSWGSNAGRLRQCTAC